MASVREFMVMVVGVLDIDEFSPLGVRENRMRLSLLIRYAGEGKA